MMEIRKGTRVSYLKGITANALSRANIKMLIALRVHIVNSSQLKVKAMWKGSLATVGIRNLAKSELFLVPGLLVVLNSIPV